MSPHILITGATGGLGQALAKEYAKEGTLLSLFGRNKELLETLKMDCEQKGAQVNCYLLDLTNTQAVIDTVTQIDKDHPITLAIANAAITSFIEKDNLQETQQQIHSVISTNLTATLDLITPIIECMQKREMGQIALICSLASYRGLPITPSYCASKAGLKAYGDALRPLLKQKNIFLSVVCPGFINTKMSEQYPNKRWEYSPQKAAYYIVTKLKKRKPNISFPLPLHLGSWALSILPSWLSDYIVMKLNVCHLPD